VISLGRTKGTPRGCGVVRNGRGLLELEVWFVMGVVIRLKVFTE